MNIIFIKQEHIDKSSNKLYHYFLLCVNNYTIYCHFIVAQVVLLILTEKSVSRIFYRI